MYTRLWIPVLAIALALSRLHTGNAENVPKSSALLLPINVRQYEAATGLQRRDDNDFSDLDPDTQSQLIYGRPGGQS